MARDAINLQRLLGCCERMVHSSSDFDKLALKMYLEDARVLLSRLPPADKSAEDFGRCIKKLEPFAAGHAMPLHIQRQQLLKRSSGSNAHDPTIPPPTVESAVQNLQDEQLGAGVHERRSKKRTQQQEEEEQEEKEAALDEEQVGRRLKGFFTPLPAPWKLRRHDWPIL